jgi:putative membrane-bound dehydrogenase-like protein
MGAVVFSYGMVGWNDSRQTTHDDPLVAALQTWNSIRAVDFISRRAGPIGMCGASGGGTQTLYASLLDERIRALAPVVIVYPWTDPDGCKCEGGMPLLSPVESNIIEVAALCAPRPQLIVTVGGDQTAEFPKIGWPLVQQAYSSAGARDDVANIHLPAEAHDLGPSKRKALYAFFAQHLSLVHFPEDLRRVRIEEPADLAAFNDDHPLPSLALQGQDAVSKMWNAMPRLVEAEIPPSGWSPAADGEEDFVGQGVTARRYEGGDGRTLTLTVIDKATGRPTPCRVCVVGSDGTHYLPEPSHLTPYTFDKHWPEEGAWGNRPGKAPYRPLGHFFYSTGVSTIPLPPQEDQPRIVVDKGFEYQPAVENRGVSQPPDAPGQLVPIHVVEDPDGQERGEIGYVIENTEPMAQHGYYAGDPHLHFRRAADRDEETIFDLLEAEDIRYGAVLAYNEPAGPYHGLMNAMASPQLRGLGPASEAVRNHVHILSGQEYRTGVFGHMNLYLRDTLVADGREYNADEGPVFGQIARETRSAGGIAIMAHGGYAQEIYADVALGHLDAVELLQFGVYRGIGLTDWYDILNAGYRFPIVGASDYPACRWLGDCRTYVHSGAEPSFPDWLRRAAAGESFVTTGPLLLTLVNGQPPGAIIARTSNETQPLTIRVRVRSVVAPVQSLQLIVNGKVVDQIQPKPPSSKTPQPVRVGGMPGRLDSWFEHSFTWTPTESCWIAVRAIGLSPGGMPNGEAHTNPVYVDLDGKRAFHRDSLDRWVERIDAQIAVHSRRSFPLKAPTLEYFQRARDTLLALRSEGGAPSDQDPWQRAKPVPAIHAGQPDLTEDQLKDFLKPLPCQPPEKALAQFETAPGFQVRLAAAEPDVVDPIAAAFDENGHLYVCEMRDYPFKPAEGKEPIGTIRLLRDTDGDGTFDESHLFADKLLWPAGVVCWKGGVFVAACPDIWYLKDTDGDHRADVREKIFTGFGTANQQAMVNNLVWGLDNKIYGATAGNGGKIRSLKDPAATWDLAGRDFRFDPKTLVLEPVTGTVQFGNAFDDWGNRFVCDESEPIKQIVLPLEYLDNNPYFLPPPAIHSCAEYPVPIFRISPVERWREIRSSRRVAKDERRADAAGASHHVIDASAGLCIYRGGAFPKEMLGQLFVGCGQNNIIHRRQITQTGVLFSSRRIDAHTEVVRTPDNWFRPVNILNTPDGVMICLDMCREVLESIHIPLDVVKHLDLTSGRDRGRIYRIEPAGYKNPKLPRLGELSSIELVAELTSPHGWRRDTAQRLLLERAEVDIARELRELAFQGKTPQARIHAVWTLDGLGESLLLDDVLSRDATDHDEHVRAHLIKLGETHVRRLDRYPKFADDPSPIVRFQFALSLGKQMTESDVNREQSVPILASLAEKDGADPYLRAAILCSARPVAGPLLEQLEKSSQVPVEITDQLLRMEGAAGDLPRQIARISRITIPSAQSRQLRQLLADPQSRIRLTKSRESLSDEARQFFTRVTTSSQADALNTSLEPQARADAVLLGSLAPEGDGWMFAEQLLSVDHPPVVRSAAVNALDLLDDNRVVDLIVDHWKDLADLRSSAVHVILARPARSLLFRDALDEKKIDAASLTAGDRERLLSSPIPQIRERAGRLFAQDSTPRSQIVDDYLRRLPREHDSARGQAIYVNHCSGCHRVANQGTNVGPPLSAGAVADDRTLLTSVLDPNRQMAPEFEQYVALTVQGGSAAGILADQTAATVTLKRDKNQADVLRRADLERLDATGKSLMPEGFEQSISPEQMADLFAYLRAHVSNVEDLKRRDFGTLPGIVEPESSSGRQR